jgi:hypothetical protein
MNAMKNLLGVLSLVAVVCCASCNKDDDGPDTCNFAQELQDELTAYTNAANAYFADPTNVEKCNAYRNALMDYLDEAEGLQSCANAAGQGTEYQQALDAAQDALDSFQC